MQPLPNLPTDNLYKFITLFGIVIFAASIWAGIALTHEAQSEFKELEALRPAASTQRASEIDTRQKHLADGAVYNQTFFYGRGGGIGIGVFLVGIFFWYRKFQRHLDRIVMAEADEATRPAMSRSTPMKKKHVTPTMWRNKE